MQKRIHFICCLLLFLAAAGTARAQFDLATNNSNTAISILAYTGADASVVVPDATNGLPVTEIGTNAFGNSFVTKVTLGANVTTIDDGAFSNCTSLLSVTMPYGLATIGNYAFYSAGFSTVAVPDTVVSLGDYAFADCANLSSAALGSNVVSIGIFSFASSAVTNITLPTNVPQISPSTFFNCGNLYSVLVPGNVTNIGIYAFSYCTNLASVYFEGNEPGFANDQTVFEGDNSPAVYYLSGTTGWGSEFDGSSTAPWTLPYPLVLTPLNGSKTYGVHNDTFGFTVSWATNATVVVEAATNIANLVWRPLQTNSVTLSHGYFSFADPDWTNYTGRFYRIRSQ